MKYFHLPPNASYIDDLWQIGHAHGSDELNPNNSDPIYVSGWCHGYCEALQCTQEEAEAAYIAIINQVLLT